MSNQIVPQVQSTDNSSLEITIRAIRDIVSMYPEFNADLIIANFEQQWNAADGDIARDWICSDTLEKFCDYSYVHNTYCRALRQGVK